MPPEGNEEQVIVETPVGETPAPIIETTTDDQSAFDMAFNEAAPVEEGTAPETPAVTEVKPGEVKPAGEKPPEKPAGEKPEPPVDYKALYEKELQRASTAEGRLRATADELVNLRKKPEPAQPVTPEGKPSAGTPGKFALTPDEHKLIEKFSKEMGDEFMKPFDALVRQKGLELIAPVVKAVIELRDSVKQAKVSTEEEHYTKILEVHSDAEELVDQTKEENVYKWAETLPYKEAQAALKVLQTGKAKQVIDLFTKYKEATGKIKSPEPNKNEPVKSSASPETVRRAQAASAVKGGGGFIPKTKADANDFDGAFAEATGQK